MASVVIHRSALADLDQIWDADPDAAAVIVALLQEAKGNQELLDSLSS